MIFLLCMVVLLYLTISGAIIDLFCDGESYKDAWQRSELNLFFKSIIYIPIFIFITPTYFL